MKLALALGYVNVDAMLESITSVQLNEWMALDEVYPISFVERMEIALGMINQTLANANRDPKKKRQPYALNQFVIDWVKVAKERRKQKSEDGGFRYKEKSNEELLANIVMWNEVLGGKDLRKK